MSLATIRRQMRSLRDPGKARQQARFFQAYPGGYGRGDRFLGLTMPQIRRLARNHRDVSEADIRALVGSPYHEERMLGLVLMVDQHRRAPPAEGIRWARRYVAWRRTINNWDLIDTSAPHVLGPHLAALGERALARLVASPRVWDRRIAMLATQSEIRRGDFGRALAVATRLVDDGHDLIQKAVGWMLREMGKRHAATLRGFLDRHAARMPRTMLRYALEKCPSTERRHYLGLRRAA